MFFIGFSIFDNEKFRLLEMLERTGRFQKTLRVVHLVRLPSVSKIQLAAGKVFAWHRVKYCGTRFGEFLSKHRARKKRKFKIQETPLGSSGLCTRHRGRRRHARAFCAVRTQQLCSPEMLLNTIHHLIQQN